MGVGGLEMIFILLLGLSALPSPSAVSPCLDPFDAAEYKCRGDGSGTLGLSSCFINDEDVSSGDFASCLDVAGRENTTYLDLNYNELTTLPEGMFQNLTSLNGLYLGVNNLTTLPEGIFQNLPTLTYLYLYNNALSSLPERIFHNLSALTDLYLADNNVTTLPEGIFQNLPTLNKLHMYDNYLSSLPEGIFHNLSTLTKLSLRSSYLSSLPEGIFHNLSTLTELRLEDNNLNTLPEGIFQDLTTLNELYLHNNVLSSLPEGIFHNLSDLTKLSLIGNNLTTLPEGIFANLPALEVLQLERNSLECLPLLRMGEVEDDVTLWAAGIHVDAYGDKCGCSILNVTDNVCGEESCTAGEYGYTCAATVTAPTPAPSFNASPDTDPVTTPEEQQPASDSTAFVAAVVSALAGVALVALAVLLKRRKIIHPPELPPPHDDNNLERGRGDESRGVQLLPCTAVLALGNVHDKSPSHQHKTSRHRHTPAEAHAVDHRGIVPPSAPAPRDGCVQSSAEGVKNGAADGGAGLAGGEGTHSSAAKLSTAADSTASASAANVSTTERAMPAPFRQSQSFSGGSGSVGASGDGSGASLATDRNRSACELGLGHAVLSAAQELAHHCQTPGISEAAAAVSIMARLVTDSRDNDRESDSRLRQCYSIIVALKRAAKVADKGGDTMGEGETARVWIKDVHEAIVDLVDLIRTFQSKNKLSKAFMSTLFKRRQEELDAVVDRAILRLQLGLQLQVGHDVIAVKGGVDAVEDDVKAVKDDVSAIKKAIQGTCAEAESESVGEVRRIRRQRKLHQVDIPEDHLFITGDLLGKGGFGEVYLADYNGHNAAAKVLTFAHGLDALGESQKERETIQRREFLRELDAMIRLRSPNTVNVYGAVTSLPDRMVLVMELLVGGDLLTLLRKSTEPLPEDKSRRIIRDICTGMAFLRCKNTVHGDLKSANVLLDGDGRAKIADFGMSTWAQHTNSTGLATYATKSSPSPQMSIAWSAPEVLNTEGRTYKSDVYSFGIVVWEVFSRERPWANKTRPTDILTAVLRGDRPSFRGDAPADIVDIAMACWSGEPNERTTFRAILERMKAKGQSDEQA